MQSAMDALLSLDPALDLTTLDSADGDTSIQTIEALDSLASEPARDLLQVTSDPDPQLTITPEKTPKQYDVRRHVTHSRHVHFDVPSSGSESSVDNKENIQARLPTESLDYDNEDEDDDVTERPRVKRYVYDMTSEENYDVSKLGRKVENHSNHALRKEIVELPENKVVRPRLLRSMDTNGIVIEEEHIFKKPELHSTLRLGLELKKLRQMEPNLKPKLEEKLQSASVQYEKLKKQEKALNFDGDLFVGRFTDLDVSDSIIARKERDISTRAAKPSTLDSGKTSTRTYAEPNIMECWMDTLQAETYSSSLPGVSTPAPAVGGAENYSIYDHLTAWNI